MPVPRTIYMAVCSCGVRMSCYVEREDAKRSGAWHAGLRHEGSAPHRVRVVAYDRRGR